MTLRLGAHARESTWSFSVWAPKAKAVELVLFDGPDHERQRIAMEPGDRGYFTLVTDAARADTLYKFALDTTGIFPDPASRSQPFGVHGPSRCVHLPAAPRTGPKIALADQVIHELHVGTFTPEGTLQAMTRELPRLRDLGVNMLDLMPLAATPGTRNWGYDGVFPFSVHHRYGGPEALAAFVQSAHAHGIGVMLDVVYNHLGPEGNYLPMFGHYFNESVRTPWGPALNFEAQHSDEVRRYFLESAEQWLTDYDVDGLRLDAVHEIQDRRAVTFLAELNDRLHTLEPTFTVLAESDANDRRYVTPTAELGHGCDIMYAEDLHHALHVALTGETRGYYQDFVDIEHVARAMKHGISYDGQYASSRKRTHGRSVEGVAPERFLVFSQNHDQIGNRAVGERLTTLAGLDAQKAAAFVILLSPYTPFIFMGEEYGETAPFQYFVEHGDKDLVEAVRKGRREEFAQFGWDVEVPDPQAETTFARSRIDPKLAERPEHADVLATYRELLKIRRELRGPSRDASIVPGTQILRFTRGDTMVAYVNLGRAAARFTAKIRTSMQRRFALGEAPQTLVNGQSVELGPRCGAMYLR